MKPRPNHLLLRLSRMDGDEMRTRLSQAANKRLDALAYRLGQDFTSGRLSAKSPGRFFFGQDELAERAALLQKLLPDTVIRICDEADAICRHRFSLLGYADLDYGKDIDWHLDAVHGKRAPLKPWHKINFLGFNEVGDHKVTWELNRHQHLVTLAKAWALTRNPGYVKELANQWSGWQQANPYPIGINWGSALEVAFRSLSWLWAENLLDRAAPLPSRFRDDVMRALMLNGRYIEKYLSTYFSPNTHLLGEAVALFFIGTLCPQLPRAERWKDRGWRIILQAAVRQVRSDGVYFEQALHYHVYALDFFLHARILAARNGMPIPADFDAVLAKMLDVVEALSQAGPPEGFGDDDGGRVFDPRRNRAEHMTDPLAIGAAVYGQEHIRAAAELTEESVWLLGERAAQSLENRPPRSIRSTAFPAGGIYVLAGASPCPHRIVVDAGPQGAGRCGHGHGDALNIAMAVNGHRLLIDPGTCSYVSDTNDRDTFRGTGAHNTMRIDELDQSLPAGPFAWTSIPTTRVERWISGDSFDFLAASHDGYSRLPNPVVHRRFLFRGPDGFWLVRDVCEGQGRHLVETFWHFAEGLQVTNRDGALVASGRDNWTLGMIATGNCEWQVEAGSGLVSPAYGMKRAAPMARVSASVELPAECAVLVALRRQGQPMGEFTETTDSQNRNVRVYDYKTPEARHTFFFAQSSGSWDAGEWTSDAAFVYCVSAPGTNAGSSSDAHAISRVIMVAGSFASRWGKRIVSLDRAVERWEWSASSPANAALELTGP